MPTITATKYAPAVGPGGSNFNTARTSNATTANNQTTSSSIRSTAYFQDSGKGVYYQFYRLFCAFNTSSYSGQTISNVTFNWRSTTGGTNTFPIIALKHTAQGSGTSFSDFSTSDFYSAIDYSTLYSANSNSNTWPDANSSNSISLNSAAQTAISSGSFRCVIVDKVYDFGNSNNPFTDVDNFGNAAYNTSTYLPSITFTATSAGYSYGVNGVDSGDITAVNAIESADITTVIGVE